MMRLLSCQLVTDAGEMKAYRLVTIWSDPRLFPFVQNSACRPSFNQLLPSIVESR
jgi:hypothetical protein